MGIITKFTGCFQWEPDLFPRPHRLVKAIVLVRHLASEAGWIPVFVGQVQMSIDDMYTHLHWSKIIENQYISVHVVINMIIITIIITITYSIVFIGLARRI